MMALLTSNPNILPKPLYINHLRSILFNQAGNLTTDYRGYQYSYDYENRLIEITDNDDTSIVEYAYDALGRRIQKDDKIAGAKTRYYHNLAPDVKSGV